ncbi:protein PLASTID MOVEMENT IMPAIRED 2 isoform X1 [Sorghum bicolor]|uniref:protein PLASTID MOVEMENT IMPAIRED 2 isoform X1 n=1 Tax=Sorghum bicolor TaxID=4558 RepID=UPI000B423754|nr:protein PLASTID MOVEMENT IMPAIRED 2 isoform X1 [Sorghum bicolor]|eukprot:XP_021313251.1 protein PLASTID MOVEMENT IMPAIRED 2 isoform X1 [Sorghum bicolor]
MDEVPGRSSSVRATRSIFGESIGGRKPETNRARNVLGQQQNLSPEIKQLAKSTTGKLNERKAAVDRERAGAESELSRARAMAKELERQIEQAKARASSKRSEPHAFRATRASRKGPEDARSSQSQEERDAAEYAEVSRELDRARRELLRLRLEVKAAAEAKTKAESDIVASAINIQSNLRAADEMKRLVDEANEEHVLVELARIEAEREHREIDAQRRADAERFAGEMEATRAKIEALRKDVSRAREMEAKLAVTNADVEVLQAEMELVRAMERNSVKNDDTAGAEAEDKALLQTAEAELDAAKKELESIKAGSFQFMTSMDSARTEIMRVSEEVNRLREQEKKADAQVQQLNAKLLKARDRLEALTATNERSKAIVSSMTSALQQLRDEKEAARKEEELTELEQLCVRAETENVNAEIAVTEARIQQSVKELEAAKAAEAKAMKKLKAAVEGTMRARASQGSRTITISRFEYEYLSGRAALVRVVAEKKVSAAQAWVQAIKAGEKELAARAEAAERVTAELRAREAEAAAEAERAAGEQKALEQELYDLNAAAERDGLLCAYPRRRSTRVSATMRRARARRSSVSSSAGIRNPRTPSFTIKRKKKVMPSLFKLIKQRKDNSAR